MRIKKFSVQKKSKIMMKFGVVSSLALAYFFLGTNFVSAETKKVEVKNADYNQLSDFEKKTDRNRESYIYC